MSAARNRSVLRFYPAILSQYSINKIKDLLLGDIYATPESGLLLISQPDRTDGIFEDAIAGNNDIGILQLFCESWGTRREFKFKCHIATVICLVVYPLVALISLPVTIALASPGAEAQTLAE